MYHIIYKRYIPRRGNEYIFSGNWSIGIDPAINFDLKMYNEKHLYLKSNGKFEGELSPKR